MKKITLLICLLLLTSNSVMAQWDTLYNVYAQSIIAPLQFDRYINDNRAHFDAEFNTCTARVENRLGPIAVQHSNSCNTYSDPLLRNQCTQQNYAASTILWISSLRQSVNNNTPWCQTLGGDLQCSAYQICEQSLAPLGINCREYYRNMLAGYGGAIEPQLTCQN